MGDAISQTQRGHLDDIRIRGFGILGQIGKPLPRAGRGISGYAPVCGLVSAGLEIAAAMGIDFSL